MDFIVEKNTFYVIIEHPKGQNLRDSILNLGLTYLEETEAKNCIGGLLTTLSELHNKHFKHGNINLSTVITQKRSNGLDFKLTGFFDAKDYKRECGDSESP